MAYTTDPRTLQLTAGVILGLGVSGSTFFLVLSAFARLLPPHMRLLAFGLGTAAGATSVAHADDLSAQLVRRLGNRAQLFHVKDMATGAFPGRIEIVGAGGIDFPSIFASSTGPVKYYVIEHDPRFGDRSFDPFQAARAGFAYLSCVTY